MNSMIIYGIIFVILLACELAYFKVADRFNIIDKPNERSSHSTIVLRGGGIIFLLSLWTWAIASLLVPGFQEVSDASLVSGIQEVCASHPSDSLMVATGLTASSGGVPYIWFLLAVTLIAGISFIDDIRSLPDSVRLVAQFIAMAMMFYQLGLFEGFDLQKVSDGSGWLQGVTEGVVVPTLILLSALIVCVGASNIINFMDGVNGITGAYAMASIIPLYLLNEQMGFVDGSLIAVVAMADVVFCLFNFRPKGKAKCFAGDVGSIGVAYILLFMIGSLVLRTGDVTYLIFLLVYGVDGVLTICHRIMLHENLGEAHRKHAYQLMANELRIGHVKVSLLYMAMQLVVSLGFIYVCPDTVLAHWGYMIGALVVLSVAYVAFKKKYYHLHEEYLASLKK